MPNDAYEHMKMLLNVNKNAKIVIKCELRANVRFLALMNRTITRLLEGILFICGPSSIICARAERGCK